MSEKVRMFGTTSCMEFIDLLNAQRIYTPVIYCDQSLAWRFLMGDWWIVVNVMVFVVEFCGSLGCGPYMSGVHAIALALRLVALLLILHSFSEHHCLPKKGTGKLNVSDTCGI